jgi:hypothetical protein
LDIEGLLKSLNAHSVRYVVIGATAFPVHGYARATLDLDLFMRRGVRRTWKTCVCCASSATRSGSRADRSGGLLLGIAKDLARLGPLTPTGT